MNNKINIPAINNVTIENTNRVYSLIEHLCEVKKLLKDNKSCNITKLLSEALNECYDVEESLNDATNQRLETWSHLLHKFYKMTAYKKTEHGEYTNITYIYPYQVIITNETLWLLEVNPSSDYNGGVQDKNYTLDTNFDYDITLEEITEAEFNKQAVMSTTHVIDRRLNREKEKSFGHENEYKLVEKDI